MSSGEPILPGLANNDPYLEWESVIAEIVSTGGTTMIIGGTDAGKSTLTRLLVNRAVAAGRPAAVLDADPGQSEIGPPACAGLAFVDAPVAALSALKPQALAFIGSISPARREIEHVVAVRRLADQAAGRFLIIDTSGHIGTPGAMRMSLAEFDLLAPAHVVALQRSDELGALVAPIRRLSQCRLHTPAIPRSIVRKPPSIRTQRRTMRFAAYFDGASTLEIPFQNVGFTGTWLGSGTSPPAHIHKFVNDTIGPSLHAFHIETIGRRLHIMSNRPIDPALPAVGMVLNQLKMRDIVVTVAPNLKNLLVGLQASNGRLLGIGILMNLDFRRGLAELLTPVRTPQAIAVLQFGTHCVAPDGTDRGPLRPGE